MPSEVTGEGRACVAATAVSPVRSVRLTAQSCSLQPFYTQKLYEAKIVFGDIRTVLEDTIENY